MFKIIRIGDKDVPMSATASTPYRYKQIFHDDYLIRAQKGMTDNEAADVGSKLAFVMAMQGAKADMNRVCDSQFYDWLDEFDTLDVYDALGEVMDLYRGSAVSTSIPKKKDEKQ